jgi:hypothetical protein
VVAFTGFAGAGAGADDASGVCVPGVTKGKPWRIDPTWGYCDTHH